MIDEWVISGFEIIQCSSKSTLYSDTFGYIAQMGILILSITINHNKLIFYSDILQSFML